MTPLERAALATLGAATIGLAAVVILVWPRLFHATPAGFGTLVAASCRTETPCSVERLTLSRGRHWLEASAPESDRLVLEVAPGAEEAPPTVLLLGSRAAGLRVLVERSSGSGFWQPIATREASGGQGSRRRLLRLSGLGRADRVRVTLERTRESSPPDRLRVEEVGLFASEAWLVGDDRGLLRRVPGRHLYAGLLPWACVALACLAALAALLVPRRRSGWAAAGFAFCLTLAATSLELWVLYSPYWSLARDLRVDLASGPVQEGVGANLNYGMYLGSRLLQGQGLTLAPGTVPWERMPGYGIFGALAGILAGFRTDIFTIGLVSIELHLVFLALASALFAAAAAQLMHAGAAVVIGVLVAFMPNQLANTQVDSIMVAVYLLTAAALALYLDRERRGFPLFGYHLLVHLSFALWFLMRPEGLVGWAALSLVLYWRSPRYLALPAVLFLAIGLSWGAYKQQYTSEFSITTNTVGDNAWISLWQSPRHKFRWQTADASYFEWASHVGVPATSKRASDTALREVARFALTYPVYVFHVALHKFVQYVDVDVFNGLVDFPQVDYRRLRGFAVWSLMAVVALCLLLPHERRRALFLGWPLFFNLPLFLFFFSDGMRHVAPVSASLLVAGVAPLTDAGFFRTLAARRQRALGVAAAFVALWFLLHWADRALIESDGFRYSTPFLDPAPFAWYLR